MSIRVALPESDHSRDILMRGHLPSDPRSVVQGAVAQRATFVCAMSDSDASIFDRLPGVVTVIADDEARGFKVKNVARAVQQANGPVLLRLPISDAGRVRQRLCSLRRVSGTNGRPRFVAVLAVPDRLMEQVWAESLEPAGATPSESTPPDRDVRGSASYRATRSPTRRPESEATSPEWHEVVQSGGPPAVKRVFVGESQCARVVRFEIGRAARMDCTVLIVGATGTGKAVIARAIHDESPRAGHPFVHVNCGGISAELLGSQMFGHVRGSFTSAVRDHSGYWREARGGTLYLDEIGDLPLESQAALLTVFDTGTIRPIGSSVEVRSNVRVIAATNKNLRALVARGEFRMDLYMRLKSRVITAPSLSAHVEDIPAIVAELWGRHGEGLEPPSSDAIDAMMTHEWPGNVREIEMCIEALVDPQRSGPVTAGELNEYWASQDRELDEPASADSPLPAWYVNGLMIEYLRCHRHLDAALVALRQAQIVMRGPMRGALISDSRWEELARQMHGHSTVLEELCKDTAGFRFSPAYQRVRGTKKLLWQVAGALGASPREAVRIWGEDAERDSDETMEILMAALQALHAEFFPSAPGATVPASALMAALLGRRTLPVARGSRP
ncbi:MAG: sigma-54-dependent Fis family transcriptional regulator [Gemmatimonadetes bacterium]|nr:sigma-54-dependent Fis family transcriptional regulator [Gemmatimonadota bacterium]